MQTSRPESPIPIRITRHIAASPERAFDAWLDPAGVGNWLFATPTGTMVRVNIDARVGGGFTITERRDGEDVEHVGTYLEIERPRRLDFHFSVPKYGGESSRVIVDIVPAGKGCDLTLTNEVAPSWADQRERVIHGWSTILDGLAHYIAGPASGFRPPA